MFYGEFDCFGGNCLIIKGVIDCVVYNCIDMNTLHSTASNSIFYRRTQNMILRVDVKLVNAHKFYGKGTERFGVVRVGNDWLTGTRLDLDSSMIVGMLSKGRTSMSFTLKYKGKFHSEVEARASLMQTRMEAA